MSFSLSQYTKIDVGSGFPLDPMGELTALPHQWVSLQRSPRPPSWFQGGRFAAGGEWRGGKD